MEMSTQRFFLIWIVVLAFHLFCYYGSQFIEGEPRVVGWKIDERIPYVPGMIYIYSSWFALLFLIPLLLFRHDSLFCLRYFLAYVLDHVFSTATYLIWPTTFTRPEAGGKGLTLFVMKTVYGANHRFLNCAPSMHCSIAFLFLFAAIGCPGLALVLRILIVILSLLIVASTVLVKQHVLLDILTALPTALICWFLSGTALAERLLRLFL